MELHLTEIEIDLITESIRAYINLFEHDNDMKEFKQELKELHEKIDQQTELPTNA